MKVTLARVCSVMRSQDKNFVFFEDAKNPVLAIEANVPGASQQKTSFLASIGFGRSTPAPTLQVSGNNVLLESVNLKGVNLIQKRFETTLFLASAVDKLKKAYPSKWKNSIVNVRVCDDRDGDRMCSDETTKYQLAVSPASLRPTALPRNVRLEVWSGRFLTLANNPTKCEQQYSPLVLDLSGGGFQFSSPEQGAWFDLDDSGEAVRTGWLTSNSNALLCRDLDANGRIDSGAELFGTATRLYDGKRAANGFEALKEYDTNGDGIVSNADRDWKALRLWIDKNRNGQSERGELYGLDRGNLKYFNLDYVEMDETDDWGNQTKFRSTYSRLVNKVATPMQIIDVWFNTLIAH